jgi:hypothetical protein
MTRKANEAKDLRGSTELQRPAEWNGMTSTGRGRVVPPRVVPAATGPPARSTGMLEAFMTSQSAAMRSLEGTDAGTLINHTDGREALDSVHRSARFSERASLDETGSSFLNSSFLTESAPMRWERMPTVADRMFQTAGTDPRVLH